MNQLNHTGSSSPVKPSSPTFNGYARFSKFQVPQLSKSSSFVKPPHMQDPQYLAHHASKPDVAEKSIALNDLEEPIKLTILSDVERDQRLEAFKESIKYSSDQAQAKHRDFDRKRKADQDSFDRFVKRSNEKLSDLQTKYNELHGCHTNLQQKYGELIEQNTDMAIKIDGYVFENNRLNALLTTKDKEIEDLKETVELYTPRSPPNDAELANILDLPELDQRSANDDDEFFDYTYSENPNIDFNQDDQPMSHYPSHQLAQYDFGQARIKQEVPQKMYSKKATIVVSDPKVLLALRRMSDDVYNYARNPFRGIDINGTRYAFYFGKVSTGGAIGLSTSIVLSSDKKVYNVSDIHRPIEMQWNQDRNSKGKRGFGHIYLGKLTGDRGFESYLKDPFMTELGVHI